MPPFEVSCQQLHPEIVIMYFIREVIGFCCCDQECAHMRCMQAMSQMLIPALPTCSLAALQSQKDITPGCFYTPFYVMLCLKVMMFKCNHRARPSWDDF